MIKKQNQERV